MNPVCTDGIFIFGSRFWYFNGALLATPRSGLLALIIFLTRNIYLPSKSLATPNAAAAAIAPIIVTLIAPHQGFTPVILLLNHPKTNRHRSVTTTEYRKPSIGCSTKK